MEGIPVAAIAGAADLAGLVGRAAAGDGIAFTRIAAAHHDGMTRMALIVTGDLDLADDAVAVAWSLAWKRLVDGRRPHVGGGQVAVAADRSRPCRRGPPG